MIRSIYVLISLLYIVTLFAQEHKNDSSANFEFGMQQNKNYPAKQWNKIVGSSTIDITGNIKGESLINNLVCDAMLKRTDTDFSFLNMGEISASLYTGDITQLDLFRLCPLARTLVVFETNGEFLHQLIESQICGSRRGMAVGGGFVEYDAKRPNHSRLTFFQIGEHPVYPKKEYRVVTTDYLINGMAGFKNLTEIDSSKVFHTGILMRDAVAEYIQQFSPLSPTVVRQDNRWVKK